MNQMSTGVACPLARSVWDAVRGTGIGRFVGVWLLVSGVLFLSGCGRGATKLETPKAATMWSLLRTAVSSEDADRLTRAGEAIETAHAEGEITDREREMFDEVLELGKQKEWNTAMQRLKRIHTLNL